MILDLTLFLFFLRVAGKLVTTTPKADSMTIAQASEWYRGQMNNLAGMIDKTLPLENQIALAEQLAKELMNGATASLYDTTFASTLREAFVQPSIEKLTAELSAKYSGSKLQETILEQLTAKIDKPRFVFETGACFIAGTLVHTKEGLVPIEKLKVGDMVLSKPENPEHGSELAYKRVVKTLVHHDKAIMQVVYLDGKESDRNKAKRYSLTSTYDHPFWAENDGWTAACRLKGDWQGPSRLRLVDGANVNLEGPTYIYSTNQSEIGWVATNGKHNLGALWNYDNSRLVANDVVYDWEKWAPGDTDDDLYAPFKTTVYNIEVEDYHTYFVGEHGVWVHNANCDGVKLWAGGDPSAILPQGTKI